MSPIGSRRGPHRTNTDEQVGLRPSLRGRLKGVDPLRQAIKRLKIHREYLKDARFLNKHLLDGGTSVEHAKYQIMLRVHSLEKGLSRRDPRYFGERKVTELIEILSSAVPEVRKSTAYAMGVTVVETWLAFCKERGWRTPVIEPRAERLAAMLPRDADERSTLSGRLDLVRDPVQWETLPMDAFVATRHSTRTYAEGAIPDELIDDCLRMAMRSPSSCNRQMVRFRLADEPEAKEILFSTLHGTGGLDYENARLAVITYDSSSLEFYGERNQGYLNAGLFTMTLVYAFHWRGVGSCLLQFGNTHSEERMLARTLGLPATERIAVGLSFGWLKGADQVPASERLRLDEVASVPRN